MSWTVKPSDPGLPGHSINRNIGTEITFVPWHIFHSTNFKQMLETELWADIGTVEENTGIK